MASRAQANARARRVWKIVKEAGGVCNLDERPWRAHGISRPHWFSALGRLSHGGYAHTGHEPRVAGMIMYTDKEPPESDDEEW